MANTLTSLIPDAYTALDVVSRELVGFIPSVARDPKADQVAQNQTLRIEVTPANAAGGNITPAMSLPAAADQTIGNVSLTITKQRFYPFSWQGEEQKSADTGPGFLTIQQDQIAQAVRGLVNEMETDIAVAAYKGASRAFGTAAATPFGTNLGESAQVKKILDDNGAPGDDRSLVINTTAGAALRTLLNNPLNANLSLNTPMTQQGKILDLNGFSFRESAQVPTVTKGTGAAYTSTAAGFAVGTTSIPLITGTGTILTGDVITFAGDLNKYVVLTGVAAPGTIVIAAPGLRQALPASAQALTVGGNFAANIALRRNAILLATRLPAAPKEGDMALDRITITDEFSGISLEFTVWPGHYMNVYRVSACWGVAVLKPEHLAILLG